MWARLFHSFSRCSKDVDTAVSFHTVSKAEQDPPPTPCCDPCLTLEGSGQGSCGAQMPAMSVTRAGVQMHTYFQVEAYGHCAQPSSTDSSLSCYIGQPHLSSALRVISRDSSALASPAGGLPVKAEYASSLGGTQFLKAQ